MSTQKYVVLSYYNKETNSYSLSCRRDIVGHPHFKVNNRDIVYSPPGYNLYKVFRIVYEGSEKDAKNFRNILELGYAGLKCNKLDMREI